MAPERQQQASCSRYSRLWMCPHVSYEYESILDLERQSKGYFRIDGLDGFPDCGSPDCHSRFYHRFVSTSIVCSSQPYMKSIISIIKFRNRGGPGTLLDQFQSSVPTARLQTAIDNHRAPICDHFMLSDEPVRNRYDQTDIDLYSDYWWAFPERGRTVRKSDFFCSFCNALGVDTKFRFAITSAVSRGSFRDDIAFFEVYAVLIRSLVVRPSLRKSPDEHRRCHGVAQKKLDQIRDTFPLTQESLHAYPFED